MLLVLAVPGSSLFAFNVLHLTIDDQAAARRAALLCALGAGSAAERTACSADVNHVAGAWMLGGVAVLLVVAGGVYALLPRWKLRRRRLVPLTAVDARVDAAARVHAPAQAPACRAPPHRGRQVLQVSRPPPRRTSIL